MTAVGFEPTPLRTGALSQRLRPLGQTVLRTLLWKITSAYQQCAPLIAASFLYMCAGFVSEASANQIAASFLCMYTAFVFEACVNRLAEGVAIDDAQLEKAQRSAIQTGDCAFSTNSCH